MITCCCLMPCTCYSAAIFMSINTFKWSWCWCRLESLKKKTSGTSVTLNTNDKITMSGCVFQQIKTSKWSCFNMQKPSWWNAVCVHVVRLRDPPAALTRPADAHRERGRWWRKCEKSTASLLLSGLESLDVLSSKQMQLCFQEDCLQRWTCVCPLHF